MEQGLKSGGKFPFIILKGGTLGYPRVLTYAPAEVSCAAMIFWKMTRAEILCTLLFYKFTHAVLF